MFNSVLDEWAYYPGKGQTTSWLVTGREAHYGGAEVWEVVPDGPPSAPIVLTTQWDISEDVVPGTLRLSDAETGQDLATVTLNQGRGMWDLVVASGQVLRYAFESESGELVEGTYALPEVGVASAVTQTMVMSMVEGAPFMEARPIARDASPMPSLKWGWDMVTNEVQTLEVQEWAVEEEVLMVAEEVPQPARRIVQFKSYPWWTETQKEERAIASNLLSTYIPDPEMAWPEASDFSSLSSYSSAIKALEDATIDHAVNAVMALASADVLKDETPWEEALKSAVLRASQLWEVGSLNVEEVGRKAQRKWAQAGAMYDQNSLPEVRDKRSLVGDGKWVEEPWIKGQVAQLADIHKRVRDTSPEALKVAWHLAQANLGEQNWDAQWEDPSMWEITSFAFRPSRNTLSPLRSAKGRFRRPMVQMRSRLRRRFKRSACAWRFWSPSSQVPGWLRKRFWRWSGNGVAWQWSSPKSLGKKKALWPSRLQILWVQAKRPPRLKRMLNTRINKNQSLFRRMESRMIQSRQKQQHSPSQRMNFPPNSIGSGRWFGMKSFHGLTPPKKLQKRRS